MSSPNDGGAAFPGGNVSHGQPATGHHGMTLRQYYAGQALVGLNAFSGPYYGDNPKQAAEICLAQADALIEEEAKS